MLCKYYSIPILPAPHTNMLVALKGLLGTLLLCGPGGALLLLLLDCGGLGTLKVSGFMICMIVVCLELYYYNTRKVTNARTESENGGRKFCENCFST